VVSLSNVKATGKEIYSNINGSQVNLQSEELKKEEKWNRKCDNTLRKLKYTKTKAERKYNWGAKKTPSGLLLMKYTSRSSESVCDQILQRAISQWNINILSVTITWQSLHPVVTAAPNWFLASQ